MRLVSFAVTALALATSLALWSCTTASNQQAASSSAAPAGEDKVTRGRYLVEILGCGDCHTPGTFYNAADTTRRLAGSELGWKGPWGISFARNLTPDSTGIGSWTDAQIVAAIREGRKTDGTPMLPPMPWPDFAHLTDNDVNAVVAYLRTLPAVHHVNVGPIPPGQKFKGSYVEFPPPPAWDAPHAAAAGAAK